MNYSNNPYGNPYFNSPFYNGAYSYQTPQPRNMQPTQLTPQTNQAQQYNTFGLQGKTVDSVDVVKATDIPLDGSVSYFPLVDNSAIITKQLQQDGTSKMIVYRPVIDETEKKQPRYLTQEDLDGQIKNLNSKDIKDIKEELKTLKRQIEDITDDLKEKKGK